MRQQHRWEMGARVSGPDHRAPLCAAHAPPFRFACAELLTSHDIFWALVDEDTRGARSSQNVLHDVACQLLPFIHCCLCSKDGHICPAAVVLAEFLEPSVPTRKLNFVWANSHGLVRKNYIRIWSKCRPACRLWEILKSQVDFAPPFGGYHRRVEHGPSGKLSLFPLFSVNVQVTPTSQSHPSVCHCEVTDSGVRVRTSAGGSGNDFVGGTNGYGKVEFNGLPALSNGYIVDGLETNDPLTNLNSGLSTNLVLGLNSISEVTVNTLSYAVDQGRYGASQVNYVTKSGSNQFHGNVYELWNGSKFSAVNYFTNATPENHKPRSTVNHFGGSVGGPIMHDKLFFFFDSEWVRIALPIVTAATVPTPAFQNYVLQQLALGRTDSVMGSVGLSAIPAVGAVPSEDVFALRKCQRNAPHGTWLSVRCRWSCAPQLRTMETVVPINLVQLFQSGVFLVWKPVAEASNQATYQQLTRILDHPTAKRG
jgi:hypothetical protein